MNKLKFWNAADFSKSGIPRLQTQKPILVALLSSSCPYCVGAADTLSQLSKDSRLVIAPILVDRTPIGQWMLRAIGARGVPAFILFKEGKFQRQLQGARDLRALQSFALS